MHEHCGGSLSSSPSDLSQLLLFFHFFFALLNFKLVSLHYVTAPSADPKPPTGQDDPNIEIVKQEDFEPEIDVLNFDDDEPNIFAINDTLVSSPQPAQVPSSKPPEVPFSEPPQVLFPKSEDVPFPEPEEVPSLENARNSQLKLCKPVTVKLERESNSLLGWVTVIKTEPLHPKATYKCDNCSQTFQAKLDLRRHLRFCARYYNYRCPHCDYHQLKFSKDLREHIKKHHQNRKWFCRVSFESSTNATGDYKHKRSIGSERILCPHCPASFIREGRLRSHLKMECRTKVACVWCGKAYNGVSHLYQHCEDVHHRSA